MSEWHALHGTPEAPTLLPPLPHALLPVAADVNLHGATREHAATHQHGYGRAAAGSARALSQHCEVAPCRVRQCQSLRRYCMPCSAHSSSQARCPAGQGRALQQSLAPGVGPLLATGWRASCGLDCRRDPGSCGRQRCRSACCHCTRRDAAVAAVKVQKGSLALPLVLERMGCSWGMDTCTRGKTESFWQRACWRRLGKRKVTPTTLFGSHKFISRLETKLYSRTTKANNMPCNDVASYEVYMQGVGLASVRST